MKKFLRTYHNSKIFLKLIVKYASQLIVAKKIEWFIAKCVSIVFMKDAMESRN
jgi:hypothetical protein